MGSGLNHCEEVPVVLTPPAQLLGRTTPRRMPESRAGYSPHVTDDPTPTGPPAPPPTVPAAEQTTRPRASNGAVGWVIAAVVVLVLAVAGGLLTAWIVANMRAVPGPIAGASPTPGHVVSSAPPASCSCIPSVAPTDAPRRTPTAPPTAEVTLPPFTYVVQPGDHLVNIANLYGVSVQDILDLNGMTNPNKIQVGQQLLIPGYGNPPPTKPPKK